jgi:RNA polymerase sigma factor (TIGR02999 family)
MAADATTLLLAWRQGDEAALGELISLVYQGLRRLAHRYMAGQRAGHTLQTTALVHETYLRLVDCRRVRWHDRTHFLAVAATLMRRILIDYARSRNANKRDGAAQSVSLDENLEFSPAKDAHLIALDECLEQLAAIDHRKSKVVELKFFGGLETAEVAEVLGVSEPTVLRDWKLAKVWLLRELSRT